MSEKTRKSWRCPKISAWSLAAAIVVAFVAGASAVFMITAARLSATEQIAPLGRDDLFIFTLTDGADSDPFYLRAGRWSCELNDTGGGSWGGATISLNYDVDNKGNYETGNLPSGLVSQTSDTGAVVVETSARFFKWDVSGGSSTSVMGRCGRIGS